MDDIFTALADPTRRQLLDRLSTRQGATLGELVGDLHMRRQSASRHLQVLEEAGLVVVEWHGREKHHYLNPVPLAELQNRWMNRFTRPKAAALAALKNDLETQHMNMPDYVYVTVINAPAEAVWDALCTAEMTERYWHQTRVQSTFRVGDPIEFYVPDGAVGCLGEIVVSDRPRELSYTWQFPRNPDVRDEAPSRVTFLLEQLADGVTRLTVRHHEFADGSRMRDMVRDGWPLVLSGLKSLLECGETPDYSAMVR